MIKHSILLVDDEEIIRKTISVDLKEKGYDVTLAKSGEEALKRLNKKKYDMVITDLKMEALNGIDVLKEVKKINSETVVMIYTGHGDVSHAIEALRLDVDDYMLKSSVTEELIFRVEHCLEKLELRRQVEQRTEDLEAAVQQLECEMVKRKRVESELIKSQKQLIEKNEELKELSIMDGLTGIYNRRYFHEYFDREWKRSIREKLKISVIMIDIDYFKHYNDTYGHLAGDDCLKRIAKALKDLVHRPADLLARYGGEEFVVVLPGTDSNGSVMLAEEMRTTIEGLKIRHVSSQVGNHVTISLGTATIFPGNESSSDKIISHADKALYKAKEAGRNRVNSEKTIKEYN